MRTVTAFDLGAFAAQATTCQNTAHAPDARIVNVKTADYERVRSGSGRFPGVMPDAPAPASAPVQQARAPVQQARAPVQQARAPVQPAGAAGSVRKPIDPFVIRRPEQATLEILQARNDAIDRLKQPRFDKQYAGSGYSNFRLQPVGDYGYATGGAKFPLEYQILATGPNGQQQLINTIRSPNSYTSPNLNYSNIGNMVQQGTQRLGIKVPPVAPPRR